MPLIISERVSDDILSIGGKDTVNKLNLNQKSKTLPESILNSL